MKYQVTVNFTFNNGEPGGLLQNTVKGRKAADLQLAANLKWLEIKGHTPTNINVSPVAAQ